MIRVMIVDDHDIVREGLKMLLSLSSDIMVVAEASNGKEALDALALMSVDVVLTDVKMPIMDGLETTKTIKKLYPEVKVIILTTFNDDSYIFDGLKNGANGYVLKDIKSDDIIKGIKTVYNGNALLQPEVAAKVVKELGSVKTTVSPMSKTTHLADTLTPREMEIAKLIAHGKSNRDISKLLYITEGTVRNHITNILSKLELKGRTQIAIYIGNNGIK